MTVIEIICKNCMELQGMLCMYPNQPPCNFCTTTAQAIEDLYKKKEQERVGKIFREIENLWQDCDFICHIPLYDWKKLKKQEGL